MSLRIHKTWPSNGSEFIKKHRNKHTNTHINNCDNFGNKTKQDRFKPVHRSLLKLSHPSQNTTMYSLVFLLLPKSSITSNNQIPVSKSSLFLPLDLYCTAAQSHNKPFQYPYSVPLFHISFIS